MDSLQSLQEVILLEQFMKSFPVQISSLVLNGALKILQAVATLVEKVKVHCPRALPVGACRALGERWQQWLWQQRQWQWGQRGHLSNCAAVGETIGGCPRAGSLVT